MLSVISEGFFINGVIAVLIAGLVAAPLGSVMVWNRLSYMGDSIAHSSLLGVGIAMVLQVSTSLTVVAIAVVLAIIMSFVIDKIHSIDAILNIMTSVVMSVGMVLLSFVPYSGESVVHSLFGDVLMVSSKELLKMLAISLFGLCVIVYRWKYWVLVSISDDLALSMGINARRIKMEILVIASTAVVLFSQFVGILLITAFLIIPASVARKLSDTPIRMVIISAIVASLSGVLGLLFSVKFDIFPGPMTIITSFLFLLAAHAIRR